ncbi:hypothetical protein CRV15_08445 [Streptomyces clavuligerus]|nr:hypothetical protein D1794_09015 [Streptomyces clavuligerus]EDY48433.1 conserved hypothetical protein [Streptomyces clavuligerus]QCS09248.1 hypothetical protein CRV15_08445 [Streptomyces clavuligerus]QPJ96812.1 hypothetical protein GE265_19485 [Streptomyces clavuligerus]
MSGREDARGGRVRVSTSDTEETAGQMETTSPTAEQDSPGDAEAPAPGSGATALPPRPALDVYTRASFAWYGLDEAFTGPRWLMRAVTTADGVVRHGSTGHGDEPSIRSAARPAEETAKERFTVVVTVAAGPDLRSGDGTGVLDATTVSSAAWLAGSGLLAHTWPPQLDHSLRDDWLEQQTETAFTLAHDLEGPEWSTLSLPVDGRASVFRFRESEFGWIIAGPGDQDGDGTFIGAYGRGMSPYGLGFARLPDLTPYG